MNGTIGRAMGWMALGALLGVVVFGLVRLALMPPVPQTHHHANFAIVIHGERVDLGDDRYMEDVERCLADPSHIEPRHRVHMHDNVDHVVHVHHAGATWGHFLANIGWSLGDEHLITDRGERHFAGEEGRLTFVVNGLVVPSMHNRAIRAGDRALISFGSEPAEEVLELRFPEVPSDAPEYDATADPGACMGAEEAGLGERLRRAFWF